MGRMERRQQQKQEKKKSNKRSLKGLRSKGMIFKISAALIALAVLMLIVFNVFVFASDVSKLESPAPQPTIIYDQNGEIASTIAATKIEGIELSEIPETMINAVIATEDQRFYEHSGVNYVAIAKAFVKNTVSGEVVAGGSTITQQLAKNAFLTQDRTYTRKIKELILAKKIERTYSKDEIMVRYLNQIYFGEGAWGIQRAAQTYFGKDAKDLTLSESAMLAGLIKAPSILSPVKNMDKAVERRNVVLSLMVSEGYISQDEADEAKAAKVVLKTKESTDEYSGKYPHYVDYIIEEATEKYGLTMNEILAGGLNIYTTLNPTMQEATEEVYATSSLFPKSTSDQLLQSAAIFIDSSTGGIQALVGGRGEHTFRQFNRATQLKRQPGSSMKPLAVYAPALEEGYGMYDTLQDKPLNINGYSPQNADKKYHGSVSMYQAINKSYNVPAVWLLQKIGLEKGVASVERFGISLSEEDKNPALALGGMNEGTSPLKMAQAFSAFPNDGVMVEAHAITEITNATGETLGEWKKKTTKVMEAENAQKMTYMLKGVVDSGTGTKAQISGLDIAGKTGTTQLPISGKSGSKDNWFVGYTPQITGAVWIGYDKTDASHYLTSSGGATAGVIFKQIMAKSKSELTEKTFDLSLVKAADKKSTTSTEKEESTEEKTEEVEEEEKTTTEQETEAETETEDTTEKEEEKAEKQEEKEEEKAEKQEEKESKTEEEQTETTDEVEQTEQTEEADQTNTNTNTDANTNTDTNTQQQNQGNTENGNQQSTNP